MQEQLIKKLGQINDDFYQKIAKSFSETRQEAWEGWRELLPIIRQWLKEQGGEDKKWTAIDIGCGNGRLLRFLSQELGDNFDYSGFDGNQNLLELAKEENQNFKNADWQKWDLLSLDAPKSFREIVGQKQQPVAIFMMAVMHHLPTQGLRKEILEKIAEQIPTGGLLIVSLWQFMKSTRLQNRVLTTEGREFRAELTNLLNIEELKQLEKNDYFLDWLRGEAAIRYCHHFSDEEVKEVESSLKKMTLKAKFTADPEKKTRIKLNTYLVLQKTG